MCRMFALWLICRRGDHVQNLLCPETLHVLCIQLPRASSGIVTSADVEEPMASAVSERLEGAAGRTAEGPPAQPLELVSLTWEPDSAGGSTPGLREPAGPGRAASVSAFGPVAGSWATAAIYFSQSGGRRPSWRVAWSGGPCSGSPASCGSSRGGRVGGSLEPRR